mmetsp:Transcript_17545/g.42101  ORF Transcript_17545/g.42101 Transcript_17545/m.42101 type:complete len:201 (-) Transcript_17545:2247-2849(-)
MPTSSRAGEESGSQLASRSASGRKSLNLDLGGLARWSKKPGKGGGKSAGASEASNETPEAEALNAVRSSSRSAGLQQRSSLAERADSAHPAHAQPGKPEPFFCQPHDVESWLASCKDGLYMDPDEADPGDSGGSAGEAERSAPSASGQKAAALFRRQAPLLAPPDQRLTSSLVALHDEMIRQDDRRHGSAGSARDRRDWL